MRYTYIISSQLTQIVISHMLQHPWSIPPTTCPRPINAISILLYWQAVDFTSPSLGYTHPDA